MTIEQLVEELKNPKYRDDEKKVELLKKHLKTDYVVYEAKLDLCKNILLKSMYVVIDGKEVYKPNSPLKYELTILCYLQTYFDFELDNQFINDFNILEKNGLTELFIKTIGDDVTRFVTVLYMMEDDLAYNNSLIPYLENKMESIDIALTAMRSAIEAKDKDNNEEKNE